jgi:hypothetical protein
MRRLFIAVCGFGLSAVFGVSVALALPTIPNGVYAGTGAMRVGGGPEISYEAVLTLTDAQMIAEYVYAGGRSESFTANIEMTDDNQFNIVENGEQIGTGSCADGVCNLDIPGHSAQETITYDGSQLLRVGSMDHGFVQVTYSETLQPREK